MTQEIAIIDYGMGNLHSVASAIMHVAPRAQVTITSDQQKIADADRVVLPGVGAIRDCMAEIHHKAVDKTVASVIASGKPLLGICVGMQALLNRSEENNGVDCLGHIGGQVLGFSDSADFQQANQAGLMKVPHMGWSQGEQIAHPLWHDIDDGERFYFVHSYFVQPNDVSVIAAKTTYGVEFASALALNNVFATQFHPEKSHNNGLQLLKNFVSWNGQP